MQATVIICQSCGMVRANLTGYIPRTIAGTGNSMCGHSLRDEFEVFAAGLIHVALSTIIRDPNVDQSARDTAHVIQEWIGLKDSARNPSAYPYPMVSGYDVTSYGLATARVLARAMSSMTAPSDAFYWGAAANVMRRKLS